MSYLVLARKYRPGTLAALVGQEHIARALTNAIAMKRVPHALLFCGARGTGKTSTARIVAKMLNCIDGPTPTPCGKCASCKEVATSTSIDVIELDAASNRGIDEIRELRSGVGYAPSRDRSKIYIIDEAHMLTDQAANAFLKTLEEPPSHVVFILATTDPQRLPITIRSRCQRYDFRRVRSADVVQRLAEICTSEGIEADPAGLYLVAREGDGSMRDSLSVLDQVIAFGGQKLDADSVASLLGVADRNRTHALLTALLRKDSALALTSIGAAHDHGMDLRTFARTMALEARDLLVSRLAGTAARDLVDKADSEIEGLQSLSEGVQTAELERLAHVLLELAEQVARARHPRLVLELGMVRLCRAASLVDVAELATRVEGLLTSGRGFGGGGGGGGRPGGGGPGTSPGGNPNPGRGGYSGPSTRMAESAPPAVVSAPVPVRTAPVVSAPTAVAPVVQAAPVVEKPTRRIVDGDLPEWFEAIKTRMTMPVEASLLEQAVVQDGSNGTIRLGFVSDFMAGQARQPEKIKLLEQGAGLAFGGTWTVEIGASDPRARTDSLVARRQAVRQNDRRQNEQLLRDDRTVRAVVEALSGEIVQVLREDDVIARGGEAQA